MLTSIRRVCRNCTFVVTIRKFEAEFTYPDNVQLDISVKQSNLLKFYVSCSLLGS